MMLPADRDDCRTETPPKQQTVVRSAKRHRGVVVPMVTPFTAGEELDEKAVRTIIDYLLEGGVDGVFVLGTTGESASIPMAMRSRLIRLTAAHVAGRALVYAGISDNCLSHSLELARESFGLGVDAVVAHPPCYFQLSQEELFDYFTLLADNIKGPLLLYNIPSTTHISLPLEVIARLSEHPNVVGLKDSENTSGRPEQTVKLVGGREDFSLFMGVSVLSARAFALGMDGSVPSSGNLVPQLWHRMYLAAQKGDWPEVERMQATANRAASVLQRNRTLGQSLAALKAAMSTQGLCEPCMLPPLHSLTESQIETIRKDLGFLETVGLCPQRRAAARPGH